MTRILISAVIACALSGALGQLLIPMLRALKAGQSIREVGPTWHNYKAGTPMMGGLMFIFASILILLGNLMSMEDYSVFYVLILGLCFVIVVNIKVNGCKHRVVALATLIPVLRYEVLCECQ